MSPINEISHIRLDEHGRAWVDGTNVKVIEVAADYLAHGSSVEEMNLQFPHLGLSQIHAALAYYYDHQEQFDSEVRESRVQADERWKASLDSPMRRRLRELGKLR